MRSFNARMSGAADELTAGFWRFDRSDVRVDFRCGFLVHKIQSVVFDDDVMANITFGVPSNRVHFIKSC